MLLKKGSTYQADVKLSFFESVASNGAVAEKFLDVGFEDVQVTGSGGTRQAVGRWTGETQQVDFPKQVTSAREIGLST